MTTSRIRLLLSGTWIIKFSFHYLGCILLKTSASSHSPLSSCWKVKSSVWIQRMERKLLTIENLMLCQLFSNFFRTFLLYCSQPDKMWSGKSNCNTTQSVLISKYVIDGYSLFGSFKTSWGRPIHCQRKVCRCLSLWMDQFEKYVWISSD
jgi:hypothetical protein